MGQKKMPIIISEVSLFQGLTKNCSRGKVLLIQVSLLQGQS